MYRSTKSKGFGAEVQRRIILGTYALSAGYYDAYYGKASQVRTLIIHDFQKAFKTCDVLLSPVAPSPAFKIGENADDPLTMYLSDIFTLSANLAGIPAASVPCGFSKIGLPIGLQLMGRHFNEEMLIRVAYNFEQATNFLSWAAISGWVSSMIYRVVIMVSPFPIHYSRFAALMPLLPERQAGRGFLP